MNPVLFVFSGLPGSGKSTLAKEIAARTKSVYLRIDTIEQSIRDLCHFDVQGEGYRLSYRIAKDNLVIGNSVVSDSCNLWNLTRREWENVAIESKAQYMNIEIICSDKDEHRERIEKRECEVEGLILPTWNDVESRYTDKWDVEHIVIDTAKREKSQSIDELIQAIKSEGITL